jgi:hypothetical protein
MRRTSDEDIDDIGYIFASNKWCRYLDLPIKKIFGDARP